MPVDAEQFRRALSRFASGVTVVTTRTAAGQPLGLTVSSFCSVSLEPPLVLVCIDNRAEANAGFEESGLFGVSLLADDQDDVSRRFASAGAHKFADVRMLTGRHGLMLVPGALAHVECRVAAAHAAGDHRIYVGEVLDAEVHAGRPLLYYARRYRHLADQEERS